jgi:hypothetical protein
MKRRRLTTILGLTVVMLLAVGFSAALLWPIPCEAEKKAALIRVGMTRSQARELVSSDSIARVNEQMPTCGWHYSDGSGLTIHCTVPEPHRIERIQIFPPDFRTSLRRMRRTLAHVLPFLAD